MRGPCCTRGRGAAPPRAGLRLRARGPHRRAGCGRLDIRGQTLPSPFLGNRSRAGLPEGQGPLEPRNARGPGLQKHCPWAKGGVLSAGIEVVTWTQGSLALGEPAGEAGASAQGGHAVPVVSRSPVSSGSQPGGREGSAGAEKFLEDMWPWEARILNAGTSGGCQGGQGCPSWSGRRQEVRSHLHSVP